MPLNRGKRSVVLDLKSEEGPGALQAVIATADVVVHNTPRAARCDVRPRLGARCTPLGRRSSSASSPRSARTGHSPGAPAYDLVAQGRSGLLTSHASHGDTVPVRAGGIPMADLTAGHLLASGVLAALVRARRRPPRASLVEVSLLGAALAVQIQDLVWIGDDADGAARPATRADLRARADEIAGGLAMNPYYRCFEASDGFLAVACLNLQQRRAFLELFGLDDAHDRGARSRPGGGVRAGEQAGVTAAVERAFAAEPVEAWLVRLGAAGRAGRAVLVRESVHADAQVRANGLVQELEQPGLGRVAVLGGVFRLDGEDPPAVRPAPALGADTAAVLREVGT